MPVHKGRCVVTHCLHRPAAAVCAQVSGWLWLVTQLLSSLLSPPQVPTSQSALTHTPHWKTSTSSLSVKCHPLLQLAVPPLQMANNSLLSPYPRLTLTSPLFPSPKRVGQLPPTMMTPPLLLLQVRWSVFPSARVYVCILYLHLLTSVGCLLGEGGGGLTQLFLHIRYM